MRQIKFTERRTFDYGDGIEVTHEAGDKVWVHEGGEATAVSDSGRVSIREDKAQRWITRNAAEFVSKEKPADDKPVESATAVAGEDGGGDGERADDDAKGGKGGAAKKAAHAGHK